MFHFRDKFECNEKLLSLRDLWTLFVAGDGCGLFAKEIGQLPANSNLESSLAQCLSGLTPCATRAGQVIRVTLMVCTINLYIWTRDRRR